MSNFVSQPTDQEIGEAHSAIVQLLIATGKCPTRFHLAAHLKMTPDNVEARLRRLADTHGIVLHPHEPECWVIAPFSTTPTIHWVDAGTRSWWAPCIWCAFGIATLVGGKVRVHTRIGAESTPVIIDVDDGNPPSLFDSFVAHFSVPPKLAWDNVHKHCALLLLFESAEHVPAWCEAHGHPEGEIVPLPQVAKLARLWYSTHANSNWRKWTIPQAQSIFRSAGLTSSFWQLEGSGTY